MRNRIQNGDRLDVPAPYPLSPGQAFSVGTFFGVASGAAAAAGDIVVMCRRGIYSGLAKKAADAVDFGDALYWDAAEKHLTTTATAGTLAGTAAASAAAGVGVVDADIIGTLV